MTNEQQSFFSVPCDFLLLADPLQPSQRLMDKDALLAMMPKAFRLMAQVNDVEQRCLPLMNSLAQHAAELAEYLSLQNKKIDLVLQMQLAQSSDARYRCDGVRFGGSGLVVRHASAIEIGSIVETRVLLLEQSVAIYAIAEVTDCQVDDDQFLWTLDFTSIMDADQEQLVHASLQVEQRQLRARAQARRQSDAS
ncbi:hypothetical protein SAMN04488540_103262 [Ferrimonas sediminum]|uniref:PilZ domain-containing protein n=1 Tax=Ferrimonas sediminum TaxID=718193 RepID=A0A1G8NX39_9GAMM|nr:hypothetical protein [Ferrimonas sediminum]SDI84763.1 hypothetical protein SAMN04488540_103262 [Ferrimonas sediminum]